MELEIDHNFGIKDAMTFDVITANRNTNISDIAILMTEHNISSVVIKDEQVEGIVTTNKIISKVVSKNISPEDITAEMVMDKFVKIDIDTSLYEASSMMTKNNVKILLVFEDDSFKGLLTSTDIVRVSPELVQIFVEQKSIDDQNYSENTNYSQDENLEEGVCEICGVYGQLEENDGKFICSDCQDNED